MGEGDMILSLSFTFSATANPIIHQNTTSVFIDSDFEICIGWYRTRST